MTKNYLLTDVVTKVMYFSFLVAAVVLLLIGYPVYTFVQASRTHGIQDMGGMKVVDLKALGDGADDDLVHRSVSQRVVLAVV